MSRTPEKHLEEIQAILPQLGSQVVHLHDALDRRTTDSINAKWDSPRFDNSQMDGYALGIEHLKGGSFPVGPTLAAGTDPADLYPQGITAEICPIMTGARLPAGTAAVVPVEKTGPGYFTDAAQVSVPETPAGQFLRTQGSDIQAGTDIIPAGTVLNPVHIALLASQSITAVEVRKKPRIIIVTGGAEISDSPAHTAAKAATIPDANGPLLRALSTRAGIEVVAHLRTDDNPERLANQLKKAIDQYQPDAVITSGGISQGRFEVIRQVLETAPNAWFGHVDQQPGGPQGLASFHDTPVIALPGNPISTLVSFTLFIPPALHREPANSMTATITESVEGLADNRVQFLRGVHTVVDKRLEAAPLRGAGSHLLARAAPATCLIRVPARTTVEAGASVQIYPLN